MNNMPGLKCRYTWSNITFRFEIDEKKSIREIDFMLTDEDELIHPFKRFYSFSYVFR